MNDLERMDGLYWGLIDSPYEVWLLEKAEADGLVYRSYEGGGGFLGLAKVRLRKEVVYPSK